MSRLTTTQGGNPMSILPNKKGGKMEAGKHVYIRYTLWSDQVCKEEGFDQEEFVGEFITVTEDEAIKFYQEHFGTECHEVMSETVVYIDVEDECMTTMDPTTILEIVQV